MAKTYNPYNAVKNISELKGKYHTAKELGGDYKQYQREAMKWYDELDQNGYADVSDELSASDYTRSLDVLGRYKPDTEFNIDNSYQELMGEAKDIGTGKSTTPTSPIVDEILGSFKGTNEKLNGEIIRDKNGNVIGGLNIDHYNTGKNQLDYVNEFDYTKQSYFDPIMDSYKLKGSDAAKGELAGGASGNSGNIDSYAAANANRQQLAFTTAGHEAARAAAQQNQENWQKIYDAMSGNLSDMGAINAENLKTGAAYYATDSEERKNALNTSASMAETEAKRLIDKYIADLTGETERYKTDAEKEIAAANNAAELDRLLEEIQGTKEINAAQTRSELAALQSKYELGKLYDNGADEIDVEYTPDELAIGLVKAIRDGQYRDITSWDQFTQILVDNGVPSETALELVENYEVIYPHLFRVDRFDH
jgi:hypothetical protein